MLLEQLRPRRADEQQRPRDLVQRPFEQVEQRLLRPVEVLDEHDRRLVGHELGQERDAALVQRFPRGERVELGVGLVAEHEPEDLVAAEPLRHRLGRVRLEQAELLAQHVGDRAIGRARAVGDAAPGAAERLGRGRRKLLPELADEPRLADAGVAGDRHEPRCALGDDAPVGGPERLELGRAADEAPQASRVR